MSKEHRVVSTISSCALVFTVLGLIVTRSKPQMSNNRDFSSALPPKNGQKANENPVTEEYLDILDKRLGLHEKKAQMRQLIDKAFNHDYVLLSVDVEAHERDTSRVTEIGVALYNPKNQGQSRMPFIQLSHIIIKENQHRRNGRYVPDHVDFFLGGRSLVLTQEDAVEAINRVVDTYRSQGICVVGHDIKGDLKWLGKLGILLPNNTLDTQVLLSITHGKKGASLKNGLRVARQPFAFLHNAGNDAYYTLVLCLCLCEPIYRSVSGMDKVDTIEEFRSQVSTKHDKPNKSKRVNGQSLSSVYEYLGPPSV